MSLIKILTDLQSSMFGNGYRNEERNGMVSRIIYVKSLHSNLVNICCLTVTIIVMSDTFRCPQFPKEWARSKNETGYAKTNTRDHNSEKTCKLWRHRKALSAPIVVNRSNGLKATGHM